MKKCDTKRKNIAILLPNLFGGGAERVASELSQLFTKEGHNVFIFTEKRNAVYHFAGKIIVLRPTASFWIYSQELTELYALTKEIKKMKRRYDIDVAISFMEKYNLANILSKRNEKVIVRVCTILSKREDLKGLYYNKHLIRILYNLAGKVVVLSKYGKEDMVRNYRINRNKIMIIPNAVIARDYENDKIWEYGDKVILSVNRLHPIKQQAILLDVIEQVLDKLPEAKLLFVGYDKSNYAMKLKQCVKNRGLTQHVIFTGQVKDVEYYMFHSKVMVVTSVVEGFPNVILEAMNQGVPIISTDCPSPVRDILGVPPELGDGKYGIIVPMIKERKKDLYYEHGVEQLSTKIIEVLTDEKLAQYYQRASCIRAKYYAKDKIENIWKNLV